MGVVEEKKSLFQEHCLSFTKQIFSLFSLYSFLEVSVEPGVNKGSKKFIIKYSLELHKHV